jgi:hypothetical protein
MKLSEMITKLTALQDQYGDVEVLITDGYYCMCYRGNYHIGTYRDKSTTYVDIGIGGCLTEDE